MIGSSADYFSVADRDVLVGRAFDESQGNGNAKVVVLGPTRWPRSSAATPRPRSARRSASGARRSA
ncbi:hypothetical protein BJF78_16480 [Pseudonocardia sp. CNS-139]|nr:hypothetical protein BJF78_16480 [Pseudonocardia sp. CNS-139]